IYTSDPEKLSLRATMPRFIEMEREHGSLIRALRRQQARGENEDAGASGARYGLFVTLQGGIVELVDAIAARVMAQAGVRLETDVLSIAPEADGCGFELEITGGAKDSFDAVVVATPARCAAELVGGFAARTAEALAQIEYASTAIIVSGHKLSD